MAPGVGGRAAHGVGEVHLDEREQEQRVEWVDSPVEWEGGDLRGQVDSQPRTQSCAMPEGRCFRGQWILPLSQHENNRLIPDLG